MLKKSMALHVANGHCTTRLIEAAGLPGRTQIRADALHDGERAYYITDASFWSLVKGLAERSPALITVRASQDVSQPLPKGMLSLAQ